MCQQGSGETGGDVVYQLSLPPLTRLNTTLRSSLPDGGSNWDSIFNILLGSGSGCGFLMADGGFGGQTCVASADDPDDPTDVQTYANTTGAAQDVFLIVDAFSVSEPGGSGPFTLTTATSPVAPGDVCSNAQPLTMPVTLPAESLAAPYVNDIVGGPGCVIGTQSNDRVYSVLVPANQRLGVTVTASGFIPTINLARACGPTLSCVSGAVPQSLGGPALAYFDNGPSPTTIFIVVDTGTTTPTGTFQLTANAGAPGLPAGDICANIAPPATFSTVLQNETFTGYDNQYFAASQAVCSYLPGLDRAYGVTIPPGQVLRATAIPTDAGVLSGGGTIDLSVSIVPSANECQTGPCYAGANTTSAPGGNEVAVRSNTGSTAETVLVVVDSNVLAAAGNYSLALNLAPPLVGDVCSDTEPAITASTTFGAETLAGYSNDYSGATLSCALASQGDRTYRITVPAGFQLTASTTTTADHGLSLVAGPASSCTGVTSCLARADAFGTSATPVTETLTYLNGGILPRSVFLIVDRFPGAGSDAYQLSVDLTPIPVQPYVKTTTTQACTTLVAPTTLIATVDDDSTSATTALPFPFAFFTVPVTHFGVTTNGNVQFFTSSAGSASQQWANTAIPSSLVPNGFAAPFWDDLHVPSSGGSPAIRSAVTGVAPNQVFTIEWFDLAIASGGGSPAGAGTRTERLNFQVKLFQTTNVVEFHYCTLTPGSGTMAAVTGGGATVGLENAAGSVGIQHSLNTAASVSTSTALRFTP